MNNPFKPGDKIVCIDDSKSANLLTVGQTYVVVAVHEHYVIVGGVAFLYPGFWARRFAFPPRKTDISIFTALLRFPKRVHADA